MRLRFNNCPNHQWEIVPREKYTIKDKTSLGACNPMMVLIECKQCKTRKWVYRHLIK